MTLMIFLIEIGIVLLGVVVVMLFFRWKNKKLQTASFEQLLSNIKEVESERKSQLIRFLMDSHALPEKEAEESGGYMLEAEKQFLEQFMKQQLEQAPITDFYANLCELLDQYLYFIPTAKVGAAVTNDNGVGDLDSDDSGLLEVADEIDEPSWGDAFEESGDEIDDSELKAID